MKRSIRKTRASRTFPAMPGLPRETFPAQYGIFDENGAKVGEIWSVGYGSGWRVEFPLDSRPYFLRKSRAVWFPTFAEAKRFARGDDS